MNVFRFVPAAITPVFFSDIITSARPLSRSGVGEFEARLAKYFSHTNAYTFCSLMRTVYACFMSLKSTSKRQKVILPRYTCPSFIHGVLAAGLSVDYCDVDPLTLSINLDSLNKYNMDDVLAVVCTNLFGLTSEIDKIRNLCKPSGTFVVEGVDYGVGTEYKGRRIGTWGDVAILNFQEGKAIPVGGGAITSSLDSFRDAYGHKRKSSQPNFLTMCGFAAFSRPSMYGVFMKASKFLHVDRKNFSMEDTIRKTSTETDFKFDSDGFDHSISPFQGRLGCRVLNRLKQDTESRLKNAQALSDILSNLPELHIIKPHNNVNKVHYIRFPVLIGQGRRDLVLKKLLENGIEASPMYIEHGMNIDASKYPGAARVASELLTLPCHPFMNDADINLIGDLLSANRS